LLSKGYKFDAKDKSLHQFTFLNSNLFKSISSLTK
jgi:hypothetical protein